MSGGFDLPGLTIREAGAAFRGGALSPVELTEAALARIAATEPDLHAWVVVDGDRALAAARAAEAELRGGRDRGPLHGVPVGVKDIVAVAGLPTRCGSAALADATPAADDAAVVARLRAAGAVILGKTVTQEFAAGVLSPPARNPWDPARIPGGSSGGSAAAVAVGAGLMAIGSDTGGSIRIPASLVGVAGFKPAYGTFATDGVHPLSPSLDTLGPLARTVDDARIAYYALLGTDCPPPADESALAGVRIGVPRDHFWERLQPDVAAAVLAAVEALAAAGAVVVEQPWPEAAAARAAGYLINRVETAFSIWPHVRGDAARLALLNPDLQTRVLGGRLAPAALYQQALAARVRARDAMACYVRDHRLDAVLAPTLPATAVLAEDPRIVHDDGHETVGTGYTRLPMPFNATGQPVAAVPCGFDRLGLPVGLQLAGRPGDEARLLAVAEGYERIGGWVGRVPAAALAGGRRADG